MTTAPVTEESILGTLDRFFAAIEARDIDTVEALYADDIQVFHNWTQRTIGKEAAVDVLRGAGRVAGLRYEIVSRHVGDGFVAQRHVLHGSVPGGPLAVPVCIVIEVAGGLITRIYEYLDSAAIAVLGAPDPA